MTSTSTHQQGTSTTAERLAALIRDHAIAALVTPHGLYAEERGTVIDQDGAVRPYATWICLPLSRPAVLAWLGY